MQHSKMFEHEHIRSHYSHQPEAISLNLPFFFTFIPFYLSFSFHFRKNIASENGMMDCE